MKVQDLLHMAVYAGGWDVSLTDDPLPAVGYLVSVGLTFPARDLPGWRNAPGPIVERIVEEYMHEAQAHGARIFTGTVKGDTLTLSYSAHTDNVTTAGVNARIYGTGEYYSISDRQYITV